MVITSRFNMSWLLQSNIDEAIPILEKHIELIVHISKSQLLTKMNIIIFNNKFLTNITLFGNCDQVGVAQGKVGY